jgi:transcriptional regulator with XRE-family HTH domain
VDRDSAFSSEQRRQELKAFLVERRRRLHADEIGHYEHPRLREGLSQADVAELAAVSLNWYELFESGRGDRRVSADFVERIARALRLDFNDRLELYRLALPEAQALDEMRQRTEKAASSVLRAIPGLVRRVIVVSDLDQIVTVAANSMHAALDPDYATIATVQNDGSLLGFATGPQARDVCNSMHRLFWEAFADLPQGQVGIIEAMPHKEELLRRDHDVQIVAVADENRNVLKSWKWTPARFIDEGAKWPARSSLAVAIHQGDALRALLGVLWIAPRKFSRIELETARAIAAIVGLVFEKD